MDQASQTSDNFPNKKKITIIIAASAALIIVAAAALFFWLAGDKSSPESVMRKNTLNVSAGETMAVSEKQIISQGDINISGELIIRRPAGSAEPVEIIAESGNIIISGKVALAESGGAGASARFRDYLAPTAWAQNFPQAASGQEIAPDISLDGSIVFTARQGVIEIRPTASIQSLDGQAGKDALIDSLVTIENSDGNGQPTVEEEGAAGKDGGNIIFNAPSGGVQIILAHASTGQKPAFHFGNGGKGGDVIIQDDQNFPKKLTPQMEYMGGQGGNSGRLVMGAGTAVSYYAQFEEGRVARKVGPINIHPSLTEPIIGQKLGESVAVSGGQGGRGGNVKWFVGTERAHTGVDFIDLIGGDGGDGAVSGGDGGQAEFISDNVFNDDSRVPREATHVTVTGGNGGDVSFSYLPIKQARGGAGGEAFASGNRGFDGSDGSDELNKGQAQQAARGGDVAVLYGDGGSVVPARSLPAGGFSGQGFSISSVDEILVAFFPDSRGGQGAPQTRPVRTIKAGDGGQGGDGCTVTPAGPGGRGGNGGNIILVKAGHGGFGAFGGNGGNLYELILGIGGNGGNGDEPGQGGQTGALLVSTVGLSGNGIRPEDKGRDGVKTAPAGADSILTNDGYQAAAGAPCEGEKEEIEMLTEETEEDDPLLAELKRTGNWLWRSSGPDYSIERRSFYGECHKVAGLPHCYDLRQQTIRPPDPPGKEGYGAPANPDPTETKTKTDDGQVMIETWSKAGDRVSPAESHGLYGSSSCKDGVFTITTDGYTDKEETVSCLNCGLLRAQGSDPNFERERYQCEKSAAPEDVTVPPDPTAQDSA